jgi:hypothetical protein
MLRTRRTRHALAAALLLPCASLAATACGGAATPASRLAAPPAFKPSGQTKCSSATSQSEPLVVEWPSAARAKLESMSKRGLVAVHYTGCEMEVLSACTVKGSYGYTPLTRKRDHVTVHDADELYAKIPLGAASLEGTLHRAGQLDVSMTIVGRYEADRAALGGELEGSDCDRATHVISALTIGAFDFVAGGSADVGARVNVAGAGAGGDSSASREVLDSDGDEQSCAAATSSDHGPPDGCGAIVRLEVMPVGEAHANAKVEHPAASDAEQTGITYAPAPGVAPTAVAPEPRPAPPEPSVAPPPAEWSPHVRAPAPQEPPARSGGRTVEVDGPADGESYKVAIDSSDGFHACSAPVTHDAPCTLENLPPGALRLDVRRADGSSVAELAPIIGQGNARIALVHTSHTAAALVWGGVGVAGVAATILGFAMNSNTSTAGTVPALMEYGGLAAACGGIYGILYALKAPTWTYEAQGLSVAAAPLPGGAGVNALLRF